MRPDGRGTLLGVLRPKYGLEDDREGEDIFGTVLRALIVGRLTLPSGGRGTLRFMPVCGALLRFGAIELAPWFDIAVELELPRLCGGRGTLRPAGCGIDLAPLGCSPRFAGNVAVPRAIGVPPLRAEDGLDEVLGGVIRLTVGRETVAADGCAAGKPAFGPNMLARVGDTFGLPILALDRFRKAPEGILARFAATGSPRSRVFRETAVSAPGLLA